MLLQDSTSNFHFASYRISYSANTGMYFYQHKLPDNDLFGNSFPFVKLSMGHSEEVF